MRYLGKSAAAALLLLSLLSFPQPGQSVGGSFCATFCGAGRPCISPCKTNGCSNCGDSNAGTTTSPRICTKNIGRCDSVSCTCDSGYYKETVVNGCYACRKVTTAAPKVTTTGWWETTAAPVECAAPARQKNMGYLKACECKSPNKIVGSGSKASTFWYPGNGGSQCSDCKCVPPPVEAGKACKGDAFCKSGLCLNDFCCANKENKDGCVSCLENNGKCEACKDNTWFLVDDVCGKKAPSGNACSANTGCTSGSCKGGVCCNDDGKAASCESCAANNGGSCNKCEQVGTFLKEGSCLAKFEAGNACEGGVQCAGGSCKGGYCCNSEGRHPGCQTCGNDGGCADTTTPYNGTPTTSSTTTTTESTTTTVTETTVTTVTETSTTTYGPPGTTSIRCERVRFTPLTGSLDSNGNTIPQGGKVVFPLVLGADSDADGGWDGPMRTLVKMDEFFNENNIPLRARVACGNLNFGRPDLFGTDADNCMRQITENNPVFTPIVFVPSDEVTWQSCFYKHNGDIQGNCPGLGMLSKFIGSKYNMKIAPDETGMDRATPDVMVDYNMLLMDQFGVSRLKNQPLVAIGAIKSNGYACNVLPMFMEWVVNCGGFSRDRFYNYQEEKCQERQKCKYAGFYRGKSVTADDEAAGTWWSTDAVCEKCAVNTFKDTARPGLCDPWTKCNAGEHVETTYPPTEVRDRQCIPCPESTFMVENSHTKQACVAWTKCDFFGAGEEEIVAPSATQDRVCAIVILNPDLVCEAGQYRHREAKEPVYKCIPCPEKMDSLPGSISREECSCVPTYWEKNEGVCTPCVQCEKDFYRDPHSTCVGNTDYTCLACPVGAITSGANSVGVDACYCPAHNYNNAERGTSPSCLSCPENSKSVEGSVDQRHCECNNEFFDSDESDGVECTECTTCSPTLNQVRDPTSSCGDRIEGTFGQRDFSCINCENGTHTLDGLVCIPDDVIVYCADGKEANEAGLCACTSPAGCSCTVNDPRVGSNITVHCTASWDYASSSQNFPAYTATLDLRDTNAVLDTDRLARYGLAHLTTLLLTPAVMPQLQVAVQDGVASPQASSSIRDINASNANVLQELPACPETSVSINAKTGSFAGSDEPPKLAISVCTNDSGSCNVCSPGSFSNADGSGCQLCAQGGFFLSYDGAAGSSTHCACELCNNGTYAPEGSTKLRDCAVCPIGTDTSVQAGYRACPCLEGFSRTDRFGACSDCTGLEGIECTADVRLVQPGFWWYFSSAESEESYVSFVNDLQKPVGVLFEYDGEFPTTYRCTRSEACLGGHGGAYLSAENVMAGGNCADGFTGPKCSICEAAYYNWYGSCKVCPEPAKAKAVAVIIIIVMSVALMLALRKNANSVSDVFASENDDDNAGCCGKMDVQRCVPDCIGGMGNGIRFMTALKIIFGHFQVTAAVKTMFSSLSWPQNYQSFISIFQIASTNPVVWILPSCISKNLDTSVYFDFTVTALMPIVAFGCFIVYFAVRRAQGKRTSEVAAISLKNFCLIFFFVYPIIGSTGFQILTPPDELCTSGVPCRHYLRTDYSVDTDLELHTKMKRLSMAAIFIYSFGVPIVLLCYMGSFRETIRNIIDGTATFTKARQAVILGLGFAYDDYKPQFWYWEVCEMMRKLFLTGIIMIIPDPNIQMFYGAGLAIVSLCIHIYCLPYRNPRENLLAALSYAAIVLTIIIGWLLWSIELESRAGLDFATEQSSSRIAGVFLIIILIVVILGIVYLLVPKCNESNKKEDGLLGGKRGTTELKTKEVVAFVNPVYTDASASAAAAASPSATTAPLVLMPVNKVEVEVESGAAETFGGFDDAAAAPAQVEIEGSNNVGVDL